MCVEEARVGERGGENIGELDRDKDTDNLYIFFYIYIF